MSTKKVSWPFYEGVLELANDEEREAILAGGPIQFLDEQKWHATKESQAVASRAFDAIRSVIRRIFENTGLRVTGIDARKIPPIREPIDPDLLLRGRISWFTSEDISCTLRVDWLDRETKIQFLKIEGSYEPEETPIIMSRSPRLAQNERIDDTERLELMQSYIDEGNPPKTAARLAILAKGRPRTQDDSEIKRLVTKFKKRLKE